jgi:transposase
MAHPKVIQVKESVEELQQYKRTAKTQTQKKRFKILLAIKAAGEKGISKRDLAKKVNMNQNTVQHWRTVYLTMGLTAFLEDARTGFKPSEITPEEHKAIEEKLHDPKNGLQGYVELKSWYEATFNKEIKYNTLLKYCIRKFKSSCKVARKSHIKKDPEAGERLKKTSVHSVTTSSKRNRDATKR